MQNFCSFCGKPGTDKCLVLGQSWIDFCDPCGDSKILTNDKGEEKTVRQVFEMAKEESAKAHVPG